MELGSHQAADEQSCLELAYRDPDNCQYTRHGEAEIFLRAVNNIVDVASTIRGAYQREP
jgi:hypothetical protein